jgi:methionyl-tRNA formyltransferase
VIVLFTNERYGAPFLAQVRGRRDVLIVLSDRESRHARQSPLRRLREIVRLAWKYRTRVWLVPDVTDAHFLARVRGHHGVVAGFNQIFDADAIREFASLVNFHPSILPLYRGPVPSRWCLRNGETRTGYTLHEVTPEIDAGRILFQEVVLIRDATSEEAVDRTIAEAAVATFERWIEHVCDGRSTWSTVAVDAKQVYRTPVEYATFDRVVTYLGEAMPKSNLGSRAPQVRAIDPR